MKENMQGKATASETMARDYDNSAASEDTYDRKLAEKTRKVSAALRDRAAYIKSRCDG